MTTLNPVPSSTSSVPRTAKRLLTVLMRSALALAAVSSLYVVACGRELQQDAPTVAERSNAITSPFNPPLATKIGVFRDGTWFLDTNGNGVWDGEDIDRKLSFGQAGDIPVVGRW